ncbi:MAG: polyprenyl synthetase family protein, partial [Gammaproteobacteria bacterium]
VSDRLAGQASVQVLPQALQKHPLFGLLNDAICGVEKLFPRQTHAQLYQDIGALWRAQVEDSQIGHAGSATEVKLYPRLMIKAAMTRLIPMRMACAQSLDLHKFMRVGMLNQCQDDMRDFVEDLKEGVPTPFTCHHRANCYHRANSGRYREIKANPLHTYLVAIEFEASRRNHAKTALDIYYQRFYSAIGHFVKKYSLNQYREFLSDFRLADEKSNQLLLALGEHADRYFSRSQYDIAKDKTVAYQREALMGDLPQYIAQHLPLLEANLPVSDPAPSVTQRGAYEKLQEAMNYALLAGGKRLRPMLSLVSGNMHGLSAEQMLPVAKMIEKCHTSSLIFDDLPAQDNSAELINTVSDYATKALSHQGLCMGQEADIRGGIDVPITNLEGLETVAHYKTGLAIEVSLVIPALLAQASDREIQLLKDFSALMGKVYQARDDVLDVISTPEVLGKPVNKDIANDTTTFVKILAGVEQVDAYIQEKQQQIQSVLDTLDKQYGRDVRILKQVAQYVATREK